jgi:hypothetical protein
MDMLSERPAPEPQPGRLQMERAGSCPAPMAGLPHVPGLPRPASTGRLDQLQFQGQVPPQLHGSPMQHLFGAGPAAAPAPAAAHAAVQTRRARSARPSSSQVAAQSPVMPAGSGLPGLHNLRPQGWAGAVAGQASSQGYAQPAPSASLSSSPVVSMDSHLQQRQQRQLCQPSPAEVGAPAGSPCLPARLLAQLLMLARGCLPSCPGTPPAPWPTALLLPLPPQVSAAAPRPRGPARKPQRAEQQQQQQQQQQAPQGGMLAGLAAGDMAAILRQLDSDIAGLSDEAFRLMLQSLGLGNGVPGASRRQQLQVLQQLGQQQPSFCLGVMSAAQAVTDAAGAAVQGLQAARCPPWPLKVAVPEGCSVQHGGCGEDEEDAEAELRYQMGGCDSTPAGPVAALGRPPSRKRQRASAVQPLLLAPLAGGQQHYPQQSGSQSQQQSYAEEQREVLDLEQLLFGSCDTGVQLHGGWECSQQAASAQTASPQLVERWAPGSAGAADPFASLSPALACAWQLGQNSSSCSCDVTGPLCEVCSILPDFL